MLVVEREDTGKSIEKLLYMSALPIYLSLDHTQATPTTSVQKETCFS